jgi:type IV pilus assembly protein PilF
MKREIGMRTLVRTMSWIVVAGLLHGCATSGDYPGGDPQEAALYNLQLGVHYLTDGRLDLAKEKLDIAVSQDRGNPKIHTTLGLLHEQLGDFRTAERHYRRAIRLDGNDPSLRNNFGTFLCRKGDYRRAEDELVKAASNRLYQQPAVAWTNAGACVRRIPDYDAAEQYFRRALQVEFDYARALWHLAEMNHERGENFHARAFFQRYEQKARLNAEALLLGASIEKKLGDREAARRYASRLKMEFPDSPYQADLAELGL